MQPYNSIGNSGVIAYETGDDHIKIKFQDGTVYLYTYASAGREHIEQMKHLASAGKGLTTFINQVVKYKFGKRL